MGAVVLGWLLWGCAPIDTDGDGLDDRQEVELGTDPARFDTDGDRLGDGEELDRGTDPLEQDSDGDTYLDGDEVNEGSDPLDSEDRIYLGGWPYFHAKDSIPDPGFDSSLALGSVVPRLRGVDAQGEMVDLYDFAFGGVPILVEVCNTTNILCINRSKWRNQTSLVGEFSYWDPARLAADEGRLHWLTVLFEGEEEGIPATPEDVVQWSDRMLGLPVFSDQDHQYYDWSTQHLADPNYWHMVWLNEDMTVRRFDADSDPPGNYTLSLLSQWFEEQDEQNR